MFLYTSLTFTILKSIVLLMYSSKSFTCFVSICDPGKKASMPITSTTNPPLVLVRTTPLTISSFFLANNTRSQVVSCSALRRLRTNWPIASSATSTKTSTSSPIARSGMSLNSCLETNPSLLKPMLITTSRSLIEVTFPLTTCFSSIGVKDSV